MKHFFETIASAILIAGLASPAVAQSTAADNDKGQALFVQHADSATLSDGVLTLNDVDNHIIAFSDRPMRATATIPTASLIELWNKGKDSFADDPPNAVLVGELGGVPTSVIVELTNPQLGDGNLTFNYLVLKGQDSVKLENSYFVIDETLWGDITSVGDMVDGYGGGVQVLENTHD